MCGAKSRLCESSRVTSPLVLHDFIHFFLYKGDVTRDDSKRRFLAQHSVAILEQCCNHSKQCGNNDATMCGAKSRLCESSRVTSPLVLHDFIFFFIKVMLQGTIRNDDF